MTDPEGKVLSQAMFYLGTKIGVLTGAIDRNVATISGAGGRAPPASSGGGGGSAGAGLANRDPSGIISALIGKIGAVVGPLALLGSALSSATSGFEPFLAAGKMLGVVLGGLLMPGFVVLAGATFALAKLLDGEITPALEEFYNAVLKDGIGTIQLFADAIDGLKGILGEFGIKTDEVTKLIASCIFPLGAIYNNLKGVAERHDINQRNTKSAVGLGLQLMAKELGIDAPELEKFKMQGGVIPKMNFGQLPPGAKLGGTPDFPTVDVPLGRGGGGTTRSGRADQGFMTNALDGMRHAITAMRQALGPPAAYTTGEGMYKEATLAGINQNPFEAEMLQIMLKQLAIMERAFGGVENNWLKPGLAI